MGKDENKVNKENNTFSYTYSAKQQEEIQNIRKKYVSKEEDKMEKLRRLDAAVYKKATVVSLILGVIGALIMGTGMSLVMTDFGDVIGLSDTMGMILGTIIGIVVMIPICLAYPFYNSIVKKEREKIAPEILRLTEEIINQIKIIDNRYEREKSLCNPA